jgi:uncharacterized protein (TIGR01244 family)
MLARRALGKRKVSIPVFKEQAMSPVRAILLALAACAIAACAGTPPRDAPATAAVAETVAQIRGLRTVRPDLLTSGQPEAEAWDALAAQGVTTVINLRPDAETEGRDGRGEVLAAGMVYHQIPVAGVDDLTADNAARLWSLIEGAPGPVLVHCASGQRAGALLALGARDAGAMSPEAALAFGQSAGMSAPWLEAAVRTRLGLPQDDATGE